MRLLRAKITFLEAQERSIVVRKKKLSSALMNLEMSGAPTSSLPRSSGHQSTNVGEAFGGVDPLVPISDSVVVRTASATVSLSVPTDTPSVPYGVPPVPKDILDAISSGYASSDPAT